MASGLAVSFVSATVRRTMPVVMPMVVISMAAGVPMAIRPLSMSLLVVVVGGVVLVKTLGRKQNTGGDDTP